MNLAIVGSRDFHYYYLVKRVIHEEFPNLEGVTIVSGGARGADSLAEQFAKEFALPTKIFPADWKRYGKSAGFLRNKQIVDFCDQLMAFRINQSPGTTHSIGLAKEQNKLRRVVQYDDPIAFLFD